MFTIKVGDKRYIFLDGLGFREGEKKMIWFPCSASLAFCACVATKLDIFECTLRSSLVFCGLPFTT